MDLMNVVVKRFGKNRLEELSDEEWETALTALRKKKAWHVIWRLAQAVPVKWCVRMLRQLQETDWQPKHEAERTAFSNLAQLAEDCQQAGSENVGGILPDYAKIKRLPARPTCVAISPDGQRLAIGFGSGRGHVGNLQVWSLPDTKMLLRLAGHTGQIRCAAFSPDGHILVSGSRDRTIRLWDSSDGTRLGRLSAEASERWLSRPWVSRRSRAKPRRIETRRTGHRLRSWFRYG
jgi:WD40 repeat protein